MDSALTVCSQHGFYPTQRESQKCWVPDRHFDDMGATGCDNHTCFLFATTLSPEGPQILMALLKGALSAEDGVGHGFARELRPGAVSACASPLARAHKGGSSLADTASPSALEETH